jgi:thioredoxin-like negative regulator of GroEL
MPEVILYFTSDWASAPCSEYRPHVMEAASLLGLVVRVVDSDREQDLARRHNVLNIPAVALDADDVAVIGVRSTEDLVELLTARLDRER